MKDNEKKELSILTERIILGQEFRIYGTAENPLFLGIDIAYMLDYSVVNDMVRPLKEDEKINAPLPMALNAHPKEQNCGASTKGGLRKGTICTFITESGLYRLLMRSDKPKAQPFQDKVCEILKEIRQTGGYIHTEPDDDDDMIIARALVAAQRKIELREKQLAAMKEENKKQQEQLEEQAPKVELANERLSMNGCISITDANKTFGLGQGKLMQWARNKGFIDKRKYIKEVNQAGRKYFKVYQTGEYRNIGITEEGMKLIKENKEEINSIKLHRNRE